MAISVVQYSVGSTGGSSSSAIDAAFGGSVVVGNKLIAVLTTCHYSGSFQTTVSTSISDNKGNTWTKRAQFLDPTAGAVAIFDCTPTTGGSSFLVTTTAVGTLNGQFGYLGIFEVSGLGSFNQANTASAASSSTSISVSTGALATTNSFVVSGYIAAQSSSGHNETSGTYTTLNNDAVDSVVDSAINYKTVSTNSAVNATYSPFSASVADAIIGVWSEFVPATKISNRLSRASGLQFGVEKHALIPVPTALEECTLFYTNQLVSVKQISASVTGSSTPSVTYSVYAGRDRSNPNYAIVTGQVVTTSTATSVTSFTNKYIPAGYFVWVVFTAVSGTVTDFDITMVL